MQATCSKLRAAAHCLPGLLVLFLAACSPGNSGPAGALDFARDTDCVLDGMSLADYPGPKGQIRYADGKTDFFCDTVELLATLLRPEQQRAISAAYVSEMGGGDWDSPNGHWTDARQAFYVKGSRKQGAMGPTLVSFAQEAEARAFAAKEGGSVLRFEQITLDMVALDGGGLHERDAH